MNILFVSSGNSKTFNITPFIKDQGTSIQELGVKIEYLTVKGEGFLGYLKNVKVLRKKTKDNNIDVIHAHYTLSGWVAVLSFSGKPIILSLMGSDAYGEYIGQNRITFKSRYLIVLTYLIQPFIKKIICKSNHIQNHVYLKYKSVVIPNGIRFDKFKFINNDLYNELGLKKEYEYVLFPGDKLNVRKNFLLAKNSIDKLNNKNIKLLTPFPVSHDQMVRYFNIASVVILPSFMEGSPNVVKEAMACNRPVVATDVGDVRWLFGNEPGYYIADFSPEDFSEKIYKAIDFNRKHRKTKGRNRLKILNLDSKSVAKQIVDIYKSVI